MNREIWDMGRRICMCRRESESDDFNSTVIAMCFGDPIGRSVNSSSREVSGSIFG